MIHYDSNRGLSDLAEVVTRTAKDLEGREFSSIVTEGVSGLLVASPVSLLLGKPLVIVRKSTDQLCQHASHIENVNAAGDSWVFVDDYVGEGKTWEHVRKAMAAESFSRYAGTYEFLYKSFTPTGKSPVKFDRNDYSDYFARY